MQYNDLQTKILQYLYIHPEGATGKQLGTYCNVSLNTIRREFAVMYDLHFDGFKLISRPSVGYQIEVMDEKKTKKFFEGLNDHVNNPLFDNNKSQFYKTNAIIRKLLTKNTYVTVTQLTDFFHYSESSVRRDLKEVEVMLQKYQLTLKQKKGYGFYVEGDEIAKRLCLIGQHKLFVNMSKELQDLEPEFVTVLALNHAQVHDLTKKIRTYIMHEPQLSYQLLDLPNVSNYIALIHSRHIYVDEIVVDEEKKHQLEINGIMEISHRLLSGMKVDVEIDWKEEYAFANIIQGYRSVISLEQMTERERASFLNKARELVEKINARIAVMDVVQDEDLEEIACVLYNVYNRVHFSMPIDPKNYRTYKKTNLFIEDMCNCAKDYVEDTTGLPMLKDMKYRFYYVFERLYQRKICKSDHLKLVILSTYGISYARHCRDRIMDLYAEFISSVTVLEFTQIDQLKTMEFDYLLTDMRLQMVRPELLQKTCLLEIQDDQSRRVKALEDVIEQRKQDALNTLLFYETVDHVDAENMVLHEKQSREFTLVYTVYDSSRKPGIYFYQLQNTMEFNGRKIHQIACVCYRPDSFEQIKRMESILS